MSRAYRVDKDSREPGTAGLVADTHLTYADHLAREIEEAVAEHGPLGILDNCDPPFGGGGAKSRVRQETKGLVVAVAEFDDLVKSRRIGGLIESNL